MFAALQCLKGHVTSPLLTRAMGSVVAASEASPFLRFSSPVPTAIDHSPLLSSLPETQVTVLPNGLRVATESIPFAETTTVGVWINSGSRFETDADNGVAHFLEHLLFKGTKASRMHSRCSPHCEVSTIYYVQYPSHALIDDDMGPQTHDVVDF